VRFGIRPWELELVTVEEWNKMMRFLDAEDRENRKAAR